MVAEGFYLIPEFTMYDYGQKPNDAAKTDLGKEWLGGVGFPFGNNRTVWGCFGGNYYRKGILGLTNTPEPLIITVR